jgi:uncharacterized membrane protein
VTDRTLRVAVAVLALAGLAIAGYLTWARYAHESVACPIGGGGCETVQESRYAELAGIPVALLGLLLYLTVLGLVAWDSPAARQAVAALALAGTAFAAYLVVIQVAVIDTVCAWCIANDFVICLAAIAATLRLWREPSATAASRLSSSDSSAKRRNH